MERGRSRDSIAIAAILCRSLQRRHAPRNLGVCHERCELRANIGGEGGCEPLPVEIEEAVFGGRIGGTGAPGAGLAISDPTDSPLSAAKAVM
jgi:hypothetical protein